MGLDQLLAGYEPKIRQLFDRILTELGFTDDQAVRLEFTDTNSLMLFRSQPRERCIKIEWRGIASLWAISQAAGRRSLGSGNVCRTPDRGAANRD